jgi:soluble lytic murein transglycosylase-like protein
MRIRLWIGIGAFAAFASLSMPVRAAERVTLTNGFVQDCDHHSQVQGRVRLYLSAGEDNYIEFALGDIAIYEKVPDSPAATAVSAPGAHANLTAADLREVLTRASKEHNVDIDLLASVVKAESDGNARAVSRAGAQGLMQLMPGTAAGLGVSDSFQPEQNVRGGSTYLDSLLTRYRDNLALALAAYNAGPEAVDKYHGIPPYRETRAYVARVIYEFNRRLLARETKTAHTATSRAAAK